MTKTGLKYAVILSLILWMCACAQINPLQGGANDTTAPKIDSSGTYPLSGQTNFKENRIVIKFQEYISLNKPKDNIIITPQLKNAPEITAKNKKLTIEFNEQLEENTTYTISFNHAITDITEKNDSVFQFVFSTGPYIDSLSLNGKVSDAFTNQPEEGYLVGLYKPVPEIEFDSIPYLTIPVYIAQTGRDGKFRMNYLKEGDYYVFAIEDKNKNLKLDADEKRAFSINEMVHVSDSSEMLDLLAYKGEVGEAKITSTNFEYPGKITFVFNNTPEAFSVSSQMQMLPEDTEREDSLIFWLESSPKPKMRFYPELNAEMDTIKPLYKGVPEIGSEISLVLETNIEKTKLLPGEKLEITSSEPIEEVDLSKVYFLDADSVRIEVEAPEIKNLRTAVFNILDKGIHSVRLDSAAIKSFYGTVNNPLETLVFSNYDETYYGSVTVNIDTAFNQPVFAELLDVSNEVVRVVEFSQKLVFTNLIPGKYQLRLIFDENNDGLWTTGSIPERRLPEKVIYDKELIDVRSKWEKEVDWIMEN